VARENFPKWDRLWDDFIQEETRRGYLHAGSQKGEEDEENVVLIGKSKGSSKKDMNKVK
jgi:hypothetical protein